MINHSIRELYNQNDQEDESRQQIQGSPLQQVNSPATNLSHQTTNTGIFPLDTTLNQGLPMITISNDPPIVQTATATSQNTITCNAPSQLTLHRSNSLPAPTTFLSSSNCPVTSHPSLTNSTVMPSMNVTGPCVPTNLNLSGVPNAVVIASIPTTIPPATYLSVPAGPRVPISLNSTWPVNPWVVTSLPTPVPQFSNIHLTSGTPTTNVNSTPDYRVIVTNPSTGMVTSGPVSSTCMNNMIYSHSSTNLPHHSQSGRPNLESREQMSCSHHPEPTPNILGDDHTPAREQLPFNNDFGTNLNPLRDANVSSRVNAEPRNRIDFEDNASDNHSSLSPSQANLGIQKAVSPDYEKG